MSFTNKETKLNTRYLLKVNFNVIKHKMDDTSSTIVTQEEQLLKKEDSK